MMKKCLFLTQYFVYSVYNQQWAIAHSEIRDENVNVKRTGGFGDSAHHEAINTWHYKFI